jgi:hypothetical protein
MEAQCGTTGVEPAAERIARIDPVATDDPIFGPSDARKGMEKSLRTVSWSIHFGLSQYFAWQPISLLNSSMLITYICCIYLLHNLTTSHHHSPHFSPRSTLSTSLVDTRPASRAAAKGTTPERPRRQFLDHHHHLKITTILYIYSNYSNSPENG